jgi:hypothetical protein
MMSTGKTFSGFLFYLLVLGGCGEGLGIFGVLNNPFKIFVGSVGNPMKSLMEFSLKKSTIIDDTFFEDEASLQKLKIKIKRQQKKLLFEPTTIYERSPNDRVK